MSHLKKNLVSFPIEIKQCAFSVCLCWACIALAAPGLGYTESIVHAKSAAPQGQQAFWRSLCNQQEEKGQAYSTRRGATRELEEDSKVGRLRDARTVKGGKDQVQKVSFLYFYLAG